MCLSKGCSDGVFTGIEAPAGKGNLACVGAQMLAPDRQNDAWIRPLRDCNQNCGADVGLRSQLGQIADERRLRRTGGKCNSKTFGERGCHDPGSKEKNAPLLQTPSAPFANASSASS